MQIFSFFILFFFTLFINQAYANTYESKPLFMQGEVKKVNDKQLKEVYYPSIYKNDVLTISPFYCKIWTNYIPSDPNYGVSFIFSSEQFGGEYKNFIPIGDGNYNGTFEKVIKKSDGNIFLWTDGGYYDKPVEFNIKPISAISRGCSFKDKNCIENADTAVYF